MTPTLPPDSAHQFHTPHGIVDATLHGSDDHLTVSFRFSHLTINGIAYRGRAHTSLHTPQIRFTVLDRVADQRDATDAARTRIETELRWIATAGMSPDAVKAHQERVSRDTARNALAETEAAARSFRETMAARLAVLRTVTSRATWTTENPCPTDRVRAVDAMVTAMIDAGTETGNG